MGRKGKSGVHCICGKAEHGMCEGEFGEGSEREVHIIFTLVAVCFLFILDETAFM